MAMQVQRIQPASPNLAPAPSRLQRWHASTAALAAAVAPMMARDRRLPPGVGEAVGPATLDTVAAPAAQPFDFSALDTDEVERAFASDRNCDGYLSGNEISPDLARYAYQAADGRMIVSREHMRSLKLRERAPAPSPTPYVPTPIPAPFAPPPAPAPYAPPPVPVPYGPAPTPTPGPETHPHDNRQSWFMSQNGGHSNPNEDVRGNANCGPTCVAMIAKAFGKIDPSPAEVDDAIEKARQMVGESRSEHAGTTPNGLDRALEGYGLDATLRRGMSIEAIQRELAAGRLLIAFVVPTYLGGRSGHFTVVTKIDGDKVYLNDPAVTKGPIEVSLAQFRRAIGARGNTLVSAGRS